MTTCTTDAVMAGVDLTGLTAVVTGASAGLGVETVRALAGADARVIACVRDEAKGVEALQGVPGAELVVLDLASLASARAAAAAVVGLTDRIDLLVNNAGVMATPLERTADGFELQLGTNHLGHFLLTTLLLDRIADGGRIVNLSSRGHLRSGFHWDDPHYRSRTYEKWEAYGQSKTANILFTVGLAARGFTAFAVHPGRIPTELSRHLTRDDVADLAARGRAGGAIPLKSVAEGAATTLWAATSAELAGRSGLYLEDCHVSMTVADGPEHPEGHRADALDAEAAERLWAWSLEQVGAGRKAGR